MSGSTTPTPSFISYPSSIPESRVEESSFISSPKPSISRNRLYVGNLHPTVDEYTLLQIFSKHGKISKLDFLFHKTGPAKGKPRGYAFIEFNSPEEALNALSSLHEKLLRGRKLTVTFAHQAPSTTDNYTSSKRGTDTSRPTTLSLLKTTHNPAKTEDKIAALEAKLRQMEQKSRQSDTSNMAILPSSLPQKPLVSSLPAVPAEGTQHKPRKAPDIHASLFSARSLGAVGDGLRTLKTGAPPVRSNTLVEASVGSKAGPMSISKVAPSSRYRANPLGIIKRQ